MASIHYDERTRRQPWIVKWRTPEQNYASFASEANARAFAELIADQSRRRTPRGERATSPRELILTSVAIDENGCWRWQRSCNRDGYSQVTYGGVAMNVHRLSYETFVGPIPEGLHIDHLCRVRDCVNPEHLEPVTPRENTMRSPIAQAALNAAKTHCAQGHAYDAANTYLYKGARICRACNRRARAQKAS